MKCIYLFGFLLLGVLSCRADENDLQDLTKDSENSDEEFYSEVKELFEKKCQAVGGDNAIKNLTRVVEELKGCIASQFPDDPKKFKELAADSSSSEEICTEKRKLVRECFDGLVYVWKDCSVDEEKYVPDFFFDAIDSLLDYFCADDGAVIFSLINDETFDCVFTLIEQEDNITNSCADQVKILKQDTPEDLIITKPELCADLNTAKECASDILTKVCPNDKNLKNAVVGAINAISSPCNKRRRRNPLNLPLPYSKK